MEQGGYIRLDDFFIAGQLCGSEAGFLLPLGTSDSRGDLLFDGHWIRLSFVMVLAPNVSEYYDKQYYSEKTKKL